ncbi:MAG: NAD(P)H-hydrate epimerase [Porphyromonas sp.]|nr:NAD(P)H-hydrate epimerase [Porphyromonas sp.]
MTPIYTSAQLAELFRRASDNYNLSTADLIERAAQGFVNLFTQYYSVSSRVHVFAGPDRTGAIALAVARMLSERGRPISVYLFYQQGRVSTDCEAERQRLLQSKVELTEVTNQFRPPHITSAELLVDGLWGSDLMTPLEGGFLGLAKWINAQAVEVVSIDLPSGLFADSNRHNDISQVVAAQRTICYEVPRLSMLFAEHRDLVGRWHCSYLGLPQELHRGQDTPYHCINESMLAELLQPRRPFSTSADYGPLLVGATRGGGLALLPYLAEAAQQVGCSAIDIQLETKPNLAWLALCPELNVSECEAGMHHYESTYLRRHRALALGLVELEGELDRDTLRDIFLSYRRPIVLDGVAVSQLREAPALLDSIPEDSILVLDKDTREELLGLYFGDSDYLEAARDFARKHRLSLILRGTYTSVVRPSGQVYFSLTGNEGMHKRGINVLLSAMLAGLMARGYDTFSASLLACHLWGAAADLYVGRHSEESLSVRGLLASIPEAWRQLER